MKASELIQTLQKLVDEHGDLPVNGASEYDDRHVDEICPYNRGGDNPTDDHPAVEFYIHLAGTPQYQTRASSVIQTLTNPNQTQTNNTNTNMQIEKNIPMPTPRKPKSKPVGRAPKYPFKKMKVGDSFALHLKDEKENAVARGRLTAAAGYQRKRYRKQFTVRNVEGGLRVWRVK